jgi:ribosomal protein S18 acetylase RimI-like enzyme
MTICSHTRMLSILIIVVVASMMGPTWALIVSPRPVTDQAKVTNPLTDSSKKDMLLSSPSIVFVARIRSTRRSDVEPVADLLSSAITGDTAPSSSNSIWKTRMDRLRVRSSMRTTLDMRVRAIQEGKKHLLEKFHVGNAAVPSLHQPQEENRDHVWYLWSQDSFRNKVKQAAALATEPHPWERHNFAMAPVDPAWLRHEMITAECTKTGQIVAFCEIAMLLCPPLLVSRTPKDNSIDYGYGDEGDEEADECRTMVCAPTIANLVVSSDWRRRGIAKGLIKSAERLVRRKWKSSELGLYVEQHNYHAINLYSDAGYSVVSPLTSPEVADKWFMSKSLC